MSAHQNDKITFLAGYCRKAFNDLWQGFLTPTLPGTIVDLLAKVSWMVLLVLLLVILWPVTQFLAVFFFWRRFIPC